MKVFIIVSILAFTLTSCNKWLDITPQDTVVEDQLFAAGDGYRNALNGIYKQMATPAMYGQELSWGLLDVMGQVYRSNAFRSSTPYYKVLTAYNYKDSKIAPLIDNIWSIAYNNIANCNNLLGRIDATDSTLFRGLQSEKSLIKGEALALRGFLHFDMLRLFAPTPTSKDMNAYIPYFKTYPSTYEPNQTSKEILELVIEDLEAAKNLVALHDTLQWRHMLQTQFRIEYGAGDMRMHKDLFFQRRGYRMNYIAIVATLARVYNYMGAFDESYYQKSYDMAEHVITFNLDPDYYYGEHFKFTPYSYASENKKLYDGVLFCLSNQKLVQDYAAILDGGTTKTHYFYLQAPATMFDDASDVRQKDLTEKSGSYHVSTKNIPPVGDIGDYKDCQDMLPMIRLSEMYYLQAEYLSRKGNIAGAVGKIDKVRGARDCQIGPSGEMAKKISCFETFKIEMAKEAVRDFMQEGQAFYYYKRFNIFPKSEMTTADFVLPKPDSEMIH